MTIQFAAIPVPASTRNVESKYKFEQLTVNGPAMVETEVVDAEKVHSKLTSALVAYRQRTGDKSKFTVRVFKQADGTDAVGVWKLADAPAPAPAPAAAVAA